MESIQRLVVPVALCFMLAGCAAEAGTQYMDSLQQYGCARGGNSPCTRPMSARHDKAAAAAGASRYQPSAIDASYTP
ncbi:MAG: hypothetical protein EPO61_04145 [Nitrospirae bacterium]|nr:MAG: hypothetical protein EPO61_04145 [Nitrospirota bacterium]